LSLSAKLNPRVLGLRTTPNARVIFIILIIISIVIFILQIIILNLPDPGLSEFDCYVRPKSLEYEFSYKAVS
jgi:hypothetical protein